MRTQKKLVWILILALVMTMLPVSGAYGAEQQPVFFQVQMGTEAGAPKPVGTKVEAGAGETVYATVNLVNGGTESIDLAGILLGLSYKTGDFSFVGAKPLLTDTTVTCPKEGDVRILNVDTKEGGKIATVPGGRQSIQLVELELRVKNITPGASIQLAMNESGNHQYQLVGEEKHVDTPVGEFGAVTVAQPLGVEVTGKVALTLKADLTSATVLLTADTIANAKAAYEYDASKAAYTAEVDADGNYSFPTVTAGIYTMLIRRPGALYYQVNNFQVETEEVVWKDVTLPVGDLDKNGTVNATDLGVLLNATNFGKSAQEAAVPTSDLDGNKTINATDMGILLNALNFGKNAVIENAAVSAE